MRIGNNVLVDLWKHSTRCWIANRRNGVAAVVNKVWAKWLMHSLLVQRTEVDEVATSAYCSWGQRVTVAILLENNEIVPVLNTRQRKNEWQDDIVHVWEELLWFWKNLTEGTTRGVECSKAFKDEETWCLKENLKPLHVHCQSIMVDGWQLVLKKILKTDSRRVNAWRNRMTKN